MSNAFTLVSLLLELWARYNETATRVRQIIATAEAEGRDVSNEELAQLRQESRDALARWMNG